MIKKTIVLFGIYVVSLHTLGCSKQQSTQTNKTQPAPSNVQIPQVKITTVNYKKIPKILHLDGTVVAYQTAEVRPQVAGILEKKLFIDGSFIRKDQPLFSIQSQQFENEIITLNANIAKHQAHLKALQTKKTGVLKKTHVPLFARTLSPKQRNQMLNELNSEINLVQAEIKLAQAKLESSQLKLDNAIIRAPISGKSSLSDIPTGSYVSHNQESPMVNIYQLNPIYIDMQEPIGLKINQEKQITNGTLQNLSAGEVVKVQLPDGSNYNQIGKVVFSGSNINKESNAFRVRAIFENDEQQLLPGMKVATSIKHGEYNHAFILPESAVYKIKKQNKQQETVFEVSVLMLDKNNKLQEHYVQPVDYPDKDGNYIINKGLKQGSTIVYNVNNLSPDMIVQPIN